MPTHRRSLAVLAAASSAGAYGPGQEEAPAAFRRHGLVSALESVRDVRDLGTVTSATFRRTGRQDANNASDVQRVALELSQHVQAALAEDADVLVLGGDCTIEIGVVAAALHLTGSVGLIYVDLDADLTTTLTSDGILDWTGVAHLLDVDDTISDLAGLGPRRPMLGPNDLVLMAVDRASEPEQHLIETLGITVESLGAVRTDLPSVLERTAAWAAGHAIVLVHVDADVLAYDDLAIADNTRRVDGLTVDELQGLVTGLMSVPGVRVLTVCEVNPGHATNEQAAMSRLVELLVAALSAPAT